LSTCSAILAIRSVIVPWGDAALKSLHFVSIFFRRRRISVSPYSKTVCCGLCMIDGDIIRILGLHLLNIALESRVECREFQTLYHLIKARQLYGFHNAITSVQLNFINHHARGWIIQKGGTLCQLMSPRARPCKRARTSPAPYF
jgi:hypothetical protein